MIFSQIHSRVPGGPAVAAVIAVAGVSTAVSFCEVPLAFTALIEPVGLAAIAVPGFCHCWTVPCYCWRPCVAGYPDISDVPAAAGVPAIVDFPIVARVPGFEYLLPLASLLSVVSLLVLASLRLPTVCIGIFNVSAAACILTILPPAFLLMLASCCCWRKYCCGVTAVAGAPTFSRIPVLLAFLRMLLSLPLLAALLVLLIRSYRQFNILIS
jgi:hypothetical protein